MDNKDLQDIKDLMKDKIAVSNFQLNSNMDKKIKKISLIKNLLLELFFQIKYLTKYMI